MQTAVKKASNVISPMQRIESTRFVLYVFVSMQKGFVSFKTITMLVVELRCRECHVLALAQQRLQRHTQLHVMGDLHTAANRASLCMLPSMKK